VISSVMVHTFHASRRLGRQQQGKDGIAAAITWQDTVQIQPCRANLYWHCQQHLVLTSYLDKCDMTI